MRARFFSQLRFFAGWEKNSFGFHADDGHSFNQAGIGQPYGPTFATGDTVGCCVNLIENTCFFTKNGVALGKFSRAACVFSDVLSCRIGVQRPTGKMTERERGGDPLPRAQDTRRLSF